jgi:hypothetical protein
VLSGGPDGYCLRSLHTLLASALAYVARIIYIAVEIVATSEHDGQAVLSDNNRADNSKL